MAPPSLLKSAVSDPSLLGLETLYRKGQLEKQGAGNGTGTGTGTGAGPERYRITSLIRAIKWV